MTTTFTRKANWDKHGDAFVAAVRLTSAERANGLDSYVGQHLPVWSKAKDVTIVTITGIAQDYGDGDVTLFSVAR